MSDEIECLRAVTLCSVSDEDSRVAIEDLVFLQPAPAVMQSDESVLIVHLWAEEW